VARTSWFDDRAEHPIIHDRVEQLDSFTSALADGQVSAQELSTQERRLVAHAKVTTLLVELSAYNVMRVLHELQTERARLAFGHAQ
jgi:hypothetical protein